MVVKIVFILCYLVLSYFLAVELLAARKWKRLVKYLGEYGFTDEQYEEIDERDRQIAKENKWIQIDWLRPAHDLKKIRKLGFIRMPVQIQFGLADELWEHTSPYYRGRILGIEGFDENWKDKMGDPRFETSPHIYITLFGTFGINLIWRFRNKPGTTWEDMYDDDQYWEQALWCIYYCDGDLKKGRRTWPWTTSKNGVDVSTWDDKYIRKSIRKHIDDEKEVY